MEIAHISDPHFGTIKPEVEASLLKELQATSSDLILCTGDITQRARASQFQDARKFFDHFPSDKVFICPGNHDIPLFNLWARFVNPLGGFREYLHPHIEHVFERDEAGVAVLNTCRRYRHIQGEMNLRRLEKFLDKIRSAKFKIVAFHQPLDCKQASDEKNLLKNREAVVEILNRNSVDLVIGGHIHDPYVNISSRYPGRPFVISVAGTCLSIRTRSGAPNSFWRYSLNGNTLRARRLDLDPAGNFLVVEDQLFTRSGEGWNPPVPGRAPPDLTSI